MNSARTTILLLAASALAVVLTTAACTSAPRSQSRQQVLVLGGTGQLGAEIVTRLVGTGYPTTVLVRPSSDRRRLAGLAVQYVEGDSTDAARMAAILRAHHYDVVISALRVENDDLHFYETTLRALTAPMKATNVRHFIFHGAVGAGANARNFASLGWERVPGLMDRLKDQGIGEDLIRASGVPFTIIRNARLYPDGTPATGKAVLTTDDTVLLPMTRADLAILTVGCVAKPECLNQTYHVRDTSLAWPVPR
jgi:uncharacterized protein YbjT (DUF2867 family)